LKWVNLAPSPPPNPFSIPLPPVLLPRVDPLCPLSLILFWCVPMFPFFFNLVRILNGCRELLWSSWWPENYSAPMWPYSTVFLCFSEMSLFPKPLRRPLSFSSLFHLLPILKRHDDSAFFSSRGWIFFFPASTHPALYD